MIDKKIKVLIFPAGAENAIEIYNSLKYNIHLSVIGLSGKSDHASYLYPAKDYFEGDYYITDEGFIHRFNEFIISNDVDMVIPTHDTIALFLAKYRNELSATIVVSNYDTALIAREKKKTYELFGEYDFCPKIYNTMNEISKYPVFVKPNIGEGSKGAQKLRSSNEIDQNEIVDNDLVICEYLPGDEITVDCFTNRFGELLFIGPRTRERVQMGISFRSNMLELDNDIKRIANIINEKLSFRGAWFFQLKKDVNNKYKLMEISVRQAGTMALYRQIGVNFALLSIFDFMNIDVSILKNESMNVSLDRCLHNRYKTNIEYDKVYIDFDDTLIVNNKVNEKIMTLIYQFINDSKKVILITKHEYDIYDSLKKYRIGSCTFDEIIHIPNSANKYDYIDYKNSILVDNYFKERIDAKNKLNIPVFDVDTIEVLLK